MGNRSTVIVGRKKWIPRMSDNSILYGFDKNIANWRSVDLTVHQLKTEQELSKERITAQSIKAVEEENAEVIILGCAAIDGIEEHIENILHIPVINPIIAGIKVTEMLGHMKETMNISHSKIYDYAGKKQ